MPTIMISMNEEQFTINKNLHIIIKFFFFAKHYLSSLIGWKKDKNL